MTKFNLRKRFFKHTCEKIKEQVILISFEYQLLFVSFVSYIYIYIFFLFLFCFCLFFLFFFLFYLFIFIFFGQNHCSRHPVRLILMILTCKIVQNVDKRKGFW